MAVVKNFESACAVACQWLLLTKCLSYFKGDQGIAGLAGPRGNRGEPVRCYL